MEGPAKTATSAYPGRVYFDKKALTKLDNNLAVLKGVKQGEQLRSWGDGHLHIDNRWMRSYPDLNAEDVEWTLRHVEWLLLAKGESSSTEEDLYLLELAGRVNNTMKFYFFKVLELAKTYENYDRKHKSEEAQKISLRLTQLHDQYAQSLLPPVVPPAPSKDELNKPGSRLSMEITKMREELKQVQSGESSKVDKESRRKSLAKWGQSHGLNPKEFAERFQNFRRSHRKGGDAAERTADPRLARTTSERVITGHRDPIIDQLAKNIDDVKEAKEAEREAKRLSRRLSTIDFVEVPKEDREEPENVQMPAEEAKKEFAEEAENTSTVTENKDVVIDIPEEAEIKKEEAVPAASKV